MMRRLLSWSCGCLVALALCLPGRVQARELAFDLGAGALYPQNEAGDVINRAQPIGYFLARAAVEVRPQWLAELQWLKGANTASLFAGTATHRLTTNWLSAGARWHWPVAPWLRPFVRAGLGATHEDVELFGNNTGFRDSAWTPHLHGSVGLDLLIPPLVFAVPRSKGGFTFGLSWEIGYAHAFGRDVLAVDDAPSALARTPLDLGTLTLTGWTQRLALTMRL